MKAFITKYALTRGIFEKDGRDVGYGTFRIDAGFYSGHYSFAYFYYHKGEWFLTKEEAVIKAEEMRQKKIKTLEKQLSKLKTLKFD